MSYYIVTSNVVLQEIKKCIYFKKSLGVASTTDRNGERIFSDKDKFSYFYNMQYKTTIYAHGNIGDIRFYNDIYVTEPIMAIYIDPNYEEFLINVDFNMLHEKGIEGYLGYILKTVEEENEERVKDNVIKKSEPKPAGNADLVTINPGAVRYEDLKAFIEKQNAERYKTNK